MFCRHCGKEVFDEAFVCPSCGGQLRHIPTAQPAPQTNRRAKFAKVSRILSTVTAILNGVALGFWLMKIIGTVIGFKGGETGEHVGAWMMVYGWIFSMIFALIACEAGTAGFVFGLIQKDNRKVKRFAIIVFVVSVVLATVGVFDLFHLSLISELSV
ncbi:MAG: hypothetical protein E7380_04725 [Clostridiales bacterium]|nr:hypothetical protein [Clostridiales bacterium]